MNKLARARAVSVVCCALTLVLVTVGCRNNGPRKDSNGDGKVSVVASVFPIAEAARAVGGELAKVTDLTPPGVEPHDLELTSDQVDSVLDADLVLALGKDFQPGFEEVASQRKWGTNVLLESLASVTDAPTNARDTLEDDPHMWLDPMLMKLIVGEIVLAFGQVDPENIPTYQLNSERYLAELTELDERFDRVLATCKQSTIVVAHEAFGWLAQRYGLIQLSLAGPSPEQEPDPRNLADLAERMKSSGITTVFTEPLAPPGVAETLAREAGAKVATLDPLEVLSVDQQDKGATYRSVMEDNLMALSAALECSEQ